jgi:hypothetical protein
MILVRPINCLEASRDRRGHAACERVRGGEREEGQRDHHGERERDAPYIGEEQEILISHNCPSRANIRYQSIRRDRRGGGEFVTKQSVPRSIIGRAEGETDVTITFVSGTGNEDASTVIHVTVLADE